MPKKKQPVYFVSAQKVTSEIAVTAIFSTITPPFIHL